MIFVKRIKKIRDIFNNIDADGIIICSPENRRYLSGFTGSNGFLIISNSELGFATDFRYVKQAEKECGNYEIFEIKSQPVDLLYEIIKKYNIKKLAYEDSFMTVSFYNKLKSKLKEIDFIPLKEAAGVIRIIKDKDELKLIGEAAKIADNAFTHILKLIKPGVPEKDIALELEYFMKKNGASKLSFDSIVASGKRSSLPHGIATDKVIENGDLVTLDFGCVYNGYCSDMTRTIVVGKADNRQKEIYNTVLKAQVEALSYIKAGVLGKDVDKAARDIISDAGYGDYFGHGLGHGVGLAVHEEPRLSINGEMVLEENMVVTDEPGIYIPDYGGVRIEDLIIVGEDKPIILSKSVKKLIEL
ncbi:MAG: Xaa-Pro peptidase family protein [Firmicutes bacterium]|nr:Xaa-Pro peptidase family protein [Bacillota bacterium]